MRVLVLDADGFVGRRVVSALASSGWAQPLAVKDSAQIESSLAQADAVANCITGKPGGILATARALSAALAGSSRRIPVVHLGSMTVYGSVRGTVTEQSPTPADLGPYAEAQLEAEKLVGSYSGTIRLRPGCEYGPDCMQWSGSIARRLMQHRLGDLGAGGDGYCNLLFIDDLVAAIIAALGRPELQGRVFNLAMPEPPTWNEYFRGFAKALGAVPLRRITRRRLAIETRLLAPPLKIAEMMLQRAGLQRLRVPPPIPPSLLRLCRQEIRMEARSAQAELGLRWTPLDVGLQSAAAWVHLLVQRREAYKP